MDYSLITDLIISIFGRIKKTYHGNSQITVDCPLCSADKGVDYDGKGNLEVNLEEGLSHCWSCERTPGTIDGLIKKFGSKLQYKTFKVIAPDYDYQINKRKYTKKNNNITEFPTEFIPFSRINKRDFNHLRPYNYIKSRGYTDELLQEFNIGFCLSGKYSQRIVIPLYDKKGNIIYFSTRSYIGAKQKYLNPDTDKDDLIFNENRIDWDKPIYITEGVFDGIPIPNSFILLGKSLSEFKWKTLYDNAKSDIIIALDPDAKEQIYRMYQKLNAGKLRNRIFILEYSDERDLGKLFENKGDFIETLANYRHLTDMEITN
jgi:DNA primase